MSKILIVDDVPANLNVLCQALETEGYKIIAAPSGTVALQIAHRTQPDLILLDIMMPGDGGVKMYRRLKGDPALTDIPVIMLSAVTAASFRHFLTMLNAQQAEPVPEPDHYLEKPVDHDQLIQLVRDTIG